MNHWGLLFLTFVSAITGVGVEPEAPAVDPLTQPMAVDRAPQWIGYRKPERLFGNTYLVGFEGLNVALIDSGDGLVLIDGALPQAAPQILANVRKLGFDPREIKYILSTEPHFDHAGGIAALERDTGAIVVAGELAAEGLRRGKHLPDDPQLGYGGTWPGVAEVRSIAPGATLKLGNVSIHAEPTPGHTMGSTSWRWQACRGTGRGKECRQIVFASSLNPVTHEDYRYSAQTSQPIVAGFRQSYALVDRMPCDILISAHRDNAFAPGEDKGLRVNAGKGACRAYAERSKAKLDARLRAGT